MRHKARIVFLVLALFVGGSFSSLRAATIVVTPTDYVSKVALAKPGDIFQLRSGNYIFSTNSQAIPSGTSSARITFQKYPGENPTLRNILLAKAVSYLSFDGFLIDAQKSVDETVYIAPPCNHIRVSNSRITGARTQGVLLPHPGADYNEFLNNEVDHNGSRPTLDHGYYIASSFNLVQGGSSHHNAARGLQIYNGYGERANGNTIRQLRSYSNSQLGAGAGISVAAGDNNTVEQCDAQSTNGPAIEVAFRNPTNTKIRRNTAGTIYIEESAQATAVEYNCINPANITNKGQGTTGLSTNSPTACGGSAPPPPTPTNVNVSQTPTQVNQPAPEPPVVQSSPSGPSTSQVAMPFLIAGVIGAALLLGD